MKLAKEISIVFSKGTSRFALPKKFIIKCKILIFKPIIRTKHWFLMTDFKNTSCSV